VSDSVLVFIVEDEALIRLSLQDALEAGGFTVASASSAEEAIAMLEADGAAYNALVTDVNLSGKLNGWDVAKRARELKPDMPVVYMTGAAAEEWASNGVPHSILLNKPFAPAQLLTAVSTLLNTAATAPS
jgi:DNA-binding NtrC family response regulator